MGMVECQCCFKGVTDTWTLATSRTGAAKRVCAKCYCEITGADRAPGAGDGRRGTTMEEWV